MSGKFYFESIDSEQCYTEETFYDIMLFRGVEEIDVFEAVKERSDDYIFCKIHGVGDRGECGNNCSDYNPRNGKSGMCKNQGQLFSAGKKVKLKLPTP